MKARITESDVHERFRRMGRFDDFGHEALSMLYAHLIDLEDDLGEEFTLDVVGLCCDYNVMNIDELIDTYDIPIDDDDATQDEIKETVMSYLADRTTVVGECDRGILFQVF